MISSSREIPLFTAAYGGTLTTEIACNWKVCVEHLLAEHTPSPDFGWHWPLLAVRRAGAVTIMEQVVPHTFLRTRLLTHVFGGASDDHKQAAATINVQIRNAFMSCSPLLMTPTVASAQPSQQQKNRPAPPASCGSYSLLGL